MYRDITELYEQLNAELLSWCSAMTGDRYEAQELVQEGFLRAIDHFETLESLDFFKKRAWMYQTIKHLFIDDLRKKKREDLSDEMPDFGELRCEYTEAEWMQLINSLPKDEGKVFVLRYLEDFTSGQIGEMLGMPAGTVRSKLHDAKMHLRELLK
ncbi:RNA polymerase sigma factor [Butyrivibrio sp. WCD3002]|uniref:RNA polymerase sigma factor n=1 Tax=Butyrivibrio sp. WCD3002 TaxID=1280676 RepID=UPI00041DA8CF|nr:RNA polymerase sigma factor [Butyrivibrio sp. WCD3002]